MAKLNEGLTAKNTAAKDERPLTQGNVAGFNNVMDAIFSKTLTKKPIKQGRYVNE
jgi:hypothetical protein